MFTTVHIASFFVRGDPAPGGSKTFFPARRGDGSVVTEWKDKANGKGRYEAVTGFYGDAGGERNKKWKKLVAWTGKGIFRGEVLNKPLLVSMTFFMPRPLADFGTGRNASILKASADEFHLQDPDATKLQRATEDALIGIAWQDDNTVQEITSRKRWNTDNETPGHHHYPGCWIEISELLSNRPVTQELDLSCPTPPTTTTAEKTGSIETSLGFNPTNAKDAPW